MYWEEMISQADGRKLPQFSVIVRGYQITFRAKVSYNEDGMPRYGLFASCSSLRAADTENDELNLRASISGRCNSSDGYLFCWMSNELTLASLNFFFNSQEN